MTFEQLFNRLEAAGWERRSATLHGDTVFEEVWLPPGDDFYLALRRPADALRDPVALCLEDGSLPNSHWAEAALEAPLEDLPKLLLDLEGILYCRVGAWICKARLEGRLP